MTKRVRSARETAKDDGAHVGRMEGNSHQNMPIAHRIFKFCPKYFAGVDCCMMLGMIPSFLWCNPAQFAAPAQNKQDEKYRVRMGSYCANPLNPGPSLKETQFLRSNFFWIVENPAPFQASLKKGCRNLHFLVPLEHWARLKN